MLRANVVPRFSALTKFIPSSLIEKKILSLPFNKIEKGIINLNLFGKT